MLMLTPAFGFLFFEVRILQPSAIVPRHTGIETKERALVSTPRENAHANFDQRSEAVTRFAPYAGSLLFEIEFQCPLAGR